MSGNVERQPQRYFALDALRGTAAILILLHHANMRVWGSIYLANSYLSVDFFFMLSGFVIAFSYGEKLSSGAMSFFDFIKVRLSRLYPMIFLGSLIGVTVFLAQAYENGTTDNATFLAAILTFFCLPTTGFDNIFPANTVFWSLFFEICINFILAALLPFMGRRAILTALVLSFVCLGLSVNANGMYMIGWQPKTFIDGIPRSVFPFLLGFCIFDVSRVIRFELGRAAFWISIAALTCAVVLPWDRVVGGKCYSLACVAVFFPALVLLSSGIRAGKLENRIAEWLGDLSYPLYAVHNPILVVFAYISSKFGIEPGLLPTLMISGPIIPLSVAVKNYYDTPARAFLRGKLKSLRVARAVSV
jgi:peptidoglycan/LPS O-acetylase OafA/YrhL